jgi:hypothetical protein
MDGVVLVFGLVFSAWAFILAHEVEVVNSVGHNMRNITGSVEPRWLPSNQAGLSSGKGFSFQGKFWEQI